MEYWKKETIDRLRSYRAQQAAIINNAEMIEAARVRGMRLRSSSADATPVKGGATPREDAMLNMISDIDRYESQQKEAAYKVSVLKRALAILSEEDRHLLEVAYISEASGGVERLREEYGFDDARQVYRKLDAALEKFHIAMHGRKDIW